MIPYALTEFDDPELDYERMDAAYDARREEQEERRRGGFRVDYQGSADAGQGDRHRAAVDAGEDGRLF